MASLAERLVGRANEFGSLERGTPTLPGAGWTLRPRGNRADLRPEAHPGVRCHPGTSSENR
jgi:hypothetical protein